MNTGFLSETVELPVSELHPLFPDKINHKKNSMYLRILSSIKEIGIIEPLVVIERGSRYYIKDGYLRWKALQELGIEKVECLVGTDGDVYTYNKRVNKLAPVQAFNMISQAVSNGVSIERIASTLNVKVEWVNRMGVLLVGIAPEIIERLKKRVVAQALFEELKKVTFKRQVEIVSMLEAANDFSVKYAKALVLATPNEMRIRKGYNYKYLSLDEREELAGQLQKLEIEFRNASSTFRDNVFNLVKLSGYIRKILNNSTTSEYLNQNYPDILMEFEKIGNDKSLDL
jgi:hypothetical protein